MDRFIKAANLIDRIITLVFEHLNIVERQKSRLVGRRFRQIADSFRYERLVVYQQLPPRYGKFKLIDENFDMDDTVYVANSLDDFFKSMIFLNRIDLTLKKLAIFGWEVNDSVNICTTFDKLEHFETHYVKFHNLNFMSSRKLKTLFFNDALLDIPREMKGTLPSSRMYGMEHILAKIKHLNIRQMLDINFFKFCVNENVLTEIEQMDLHVTNFETATFVIKSFPTLKRLVVLIDRDIQTFLTKADNRRLKQLANLVRKDLDFYIWGVKFDKTRVQFLLNFLTSIREYVTVKYSRISLIGTGDGKLFSAFNDRLDELDEFFSLVNDVTFQNIEDELAYERMENVENVLFVYHEDAEDFNTEIYDQNFKQYLRLFTDLKVICTIHYSYVNHPNYNSLLDLIPDYSRHLLSIHLDCWGVVNFKFLKRLIKLKKIELKLAFPICEFEMMEIIYYLKYLVMFDVFFGRPAGLTRDKLKNIRTKVLTYVRERTGYRDISFRIEDCERERYYASRFLYERARSHGDSEPILKVYGDNAGEYPQRYGPEFEIIFVMMKQILPYVYQALGEQMGQAAI